MSFSQAIGYTRADKAALTDAYVGKRVRDLPTPACILNRRTIKRNCEAMLQNASSLAANFRAHIKTHKTLEGVKYQLGSAGHGKVIVSTVMEAYSLSPLVEQGLVTDILYGLPVVTSRIPELAQLMTLVPYFRTMLDSEDQLRALLSYSREHKIPKKWSIFIKVDCGTHRAGLPSSSEALKSLISRALSTEIQEYVSIYGFYCHAGHSYSDKSPEQAKSTLLDEIDAANRAVAVALSIQEGSYVISVGATPTAHASSVLEASEVSSLHLKGDLELHAGCYPFCDLQQLATNLISKDDIAIRVLSEVVSQYHDRQEMLINAGGIALSRETGPIPGFGTVSEPATRQGWHVGRISQEHGILVTGGLAGEMIQVGSKILLIPQHACITGSAYGWYYVVDEEGLDACVVDVWTRFNGW